MTYIYIVEYIVEVTDGLNTLNRGCRLVTQFALHQNITPWET